MCVGSQTLNWKPLHSGNVLRKPKTQQEMDPPPPKKKVRYNKLEMQSFVFFFREFKPFISLTEKNWET